MKSNLEVKPDEGMADAGPVKHVHVFTPSGSSGGAAPRQDAPALQELLEKEFIHKEEPAAAARGGWALSPVQSRLLKTVAGLALVALVGWMPLQRLFQVSSVEAVVNAQVVTLRAPIGGVIAGNSAPLRVGEPVASGDVLMAVDNARADHNGVERATEELQSAQEDLAAVGARIDRLEALRTAIAARVDDYRADRIRRVAANIDVAEAQINSAQAVMERASAEVKRQTSLAASGVGTAAIHQTAERDLAVARAAFDEAKAGKKALSIEADALNAGRFFGDSYDDVPQSVQRLDEIDENLASLAPDKGRLETRVARLSADLQGERARFDLASRAAINAPAGGQVWEMLTSPGEQVVTGQPLVSVLDCSKLMVTAVVSEAVYNTLSVGMPATFTFREGDHAFPGHVVQLSGVAAAGSNFAILPSALTRESYRVTVAADNLTSNGSCPVGQTGRVVFGKQSS